MKYNPIYKADSLSPTRRFQARQRWALLAIATAILTVAGAVLGQGFGDSTPTVNAAPNNALVHPTDNRSNVIIGLQDNQDTPALEPEGTILAGENNPITTAAGQQPGTDQNEPTN